MTQEFETASAISAGGFPWLRRQAAHADLIGSPCANCGQVLLGPWCHVCGQHGEDFHRSIYRLAGEAFEGLSHFDSWLWRTLPDLVLRPDRLTRGYLAGHRAPQIPPLRVFLVVLLLVFPAGSLSRPTVVIVRASPDSGLKVISSQSLTEMTPEDRADLVSMEKAGGRATEWLRGHEKAALRDPDRFFMVLERWGERFAFLLMPMSTLLLGLLFVSQRRFVLFDHAIFSLHSLSAIGLLLIPVMALEGVAGAGVDWLLLLGPLHLFRHMRGVYEVSVLGALTRMSLLALGSAIGFGLLVVGLISVGLNAMGGE